MHCDHSQIRKSPASLSQNWQNFNEESAPGFNNSVSHRRRFPTALEITPQFHLRMQPAFQAHVDAAVSKTVNLPHDAPPSTVREIFMLARNLHPSRASLSTVMVRVLDRPRRSSMMERGRTAVSVPFKLFQC